LLWALKFGGETTLAPVLAELMAVAVEEWLEREAVPDLLVPMPLHWSRQLYRGFNQASLLATALVRHPRLRHYQLHTAHRLCRRVRPTGIQSRLGRRDRLRNLQGAFNSKPLLAGQHVVIVDDVFTTGASIEQLAGALRQAGAGRVDAWCCARTPEPVH
jgi:ComF family protein